MTAAPPAADLLLPGSPGRRWRLRAPADTRAFERAPWPPLVSTLLAHRGVRTVAEGEHYLGAPGELTAATLMPNLDVAVGRLARACRAGERVAVFGDFDVDGVTATVVLTEGLAALGARPLPYVPDRFSEGYGPNPAAVRELHARGATVFVTADCGTSAVAEIALANELGMDAIVIDHHTAPDLLPDALAIVNPKLDGSQYGSEPAAVGVAYKVVHDLHERLGVPYDPDEHRALAALGCICDLAPLLGETRDLVRLGLAALARTRRPGLRALAQAARVDLADADVEMCGWALGPRLNAAGRMEHARLALELLLTHDPAEAAALAARLEALNVQRRVDTTRACELALSLLSDEDRAGPLLLVASSEISAGIVGLVAARLVEQCYRPAIVAELRDGVAGPEARASCRSIPDFDITALLRRNAQLFTRYGGHRAAAGFSLDPARLPEARAALLADAAQQLDTSALLPTIDIDAELPLRDVDGELLRWLQRVGPHGEGNHAPVFLARGVRVLESRLLGADQSHLQFKLKEGPVTWRAIAFRSAERAVPDGAPADLVYTFRRDALRGTLQLEVLDLRPSA
jgi:single-stranded-DNA-specific exonuclease